MNDKMELDFESLASEIDIAELALDASPRLESLAASHVKRDELISMMLQDRNSLRVIVAPHGFGKTELAREYAQRLFPADAVSLVNASSPDFLLALDSDDRAILRRNATSPGLIILDDLPWLHEQRAQTLSRCIDAALYVGIEIIVTTTPSCDTLSVLQPDRLCVHATDLLVTEQECAPRQVTEQDGGSRAFARKRWSDAGKLLFGRAPSVIWGTNTFAQRECLKGLFSEKLPTNLLRGMFAMFLFEMGTMRDLESAGIALRNEDISLLARDYPIFGIDTISGEFKVMHFELADLKHAVFANKLEPVVLEGSHALSERVLGSLFRRNDLRRGSAVIDAFCNDERCASWLVERGWDFLDAGETHLVSTLLDRCPEAAYASSGVLQTIHAWVAGLSGDTREACHIARHVLAVREEAGKPDAASVASRVALAVFDENAMVETRQRELSSEYGPSCAIDFLANVLDICSNAEIARAFRPDAFDGDIRYEKARRAPGKQRVRQLMTLFTAHAGAFGDSRAFRLSLHVLAHVDNSDLRHLVQDLGCDAVLRMRRCGVTTFSEAVLVRDLWDTGYFGLVGPVIDRRDAKVLDGATHMLEMLASYCGLESIPIPWELRGLSSNKTAGMPKPNVVSSGVDEMYVRLFGGFEVTVGDTFLSEGKLRKKARALFAMLVLNHGRDVPRDDLFKQIWPGLSRTHALDNFYTIWGNCVSVVGEDPYLERNGEYCRIDPRFVRSDVGEFEQLTRHLLVSEHDANYLLDTYAKIEVLYRGSLLPSEKNVRAINAQRDRYRALYVDAMVAATDCALRVHDTRIALWFARKAMEEDQAREDVYRVLMKAQIASGQRCPAIKTYLACRDYLQGTLGLDPSIETRELYNALVTTDPELLRLEAAITQKTV